LNLDPLVWLNIRENGVYFRGKGELEVMEQFSRRRRLIKKII